MGRVDESLHTANSGPTSTPRRMRHQELHMPRSLCLLMYQNLALTAEVLVGPREHHRAPGGIWPNPHTLLGGKGLLDSNRSREHGVWTNSQRYGNVFSHQTRPGLCFPVGGREKVTRLRGCQKRVSVSAGGRGKVAGRHGLPHTPKVSRGRRQPGRGCLASGWQAGMVPEQTRGTGHTWVP